MERTDFLVIGSGLAGLTFALEASKYGEVVVLTKAKITDSNTSWAQGGIAAAIGESDDWSLHLEDTLLAGAGLCDERAVEFLVQQAPSAIEWLQSQGATFDLNESNALDLGREGGHSRHRIVHHADNTGWEIERAVSQAAKANKNIKIYEEAYVTNLIVQDGKCYGATVVIDQIGEKQFFAKATMLATGGCGQIYSNTTNPSTATADGIGLAERAGAEIENMEFMQFHPTTLNHKQLQGFLITEAMRGAGATLRNHRGKRFMYDYDRRLELAPRDVVARSIQQEMEKLQTWCVYLDATHLQPELLQDEFPNIWQKLRTLGLKIECEWIPVVPAQHYMCGGVTTNLIGQTNIKRLYASGEVTCTGVHGANRLASNSLLEAIVFSRAASEDVRDLSELDIPENLQDQSPKTISEFEAIRIRHATQHIMSSNAGIFRTTQGLDVAHEKLNKLWQEYESLPQAPFSEYSQEALNILTTSRLVVNQAKQRRKNIGLHFNVDYSV